MSKFSLQSPVGPIATIDGQTCVYFGGASYFCLHNRQSVISASTSAAKRFGLGSAASRASTGTGGLLENVEAMAARFFGRDDAVYLASGFLTAFAATQELVKSCDAIFADESVHISNLLAARATGKPLFLFSHLKPENLSALLSENLSAGQVPLIMTDGVFPAFGEIAPIAEYQVLAQRYGGSVWVDDSHAIAILGENGRGSVEHFGLSSDSIISGGSCAKAIGGFGGIVYGDKGFVQELKQGSIATAASSPSAPDAAATSEGMRLLMMQPELRKQLWNNVSRLKCGFREIGIPVDDSVVPIVAWQYDDIQAMASLRDSLYEAGIYIQFIQSYGGSDTGGILRVSIFSEHTFDQIDLLISELGRRVTPRYDGRLS